jgi:DNA-binding MarR family transcriptional regulator
VSQRTEAELVDALLDASRALVGVAARSLAGSDDVTLPQWRALVLVSSRRRTTVSDLAHALGIHPTSASRLCDRLVRKRLIRRTEATDDRRQTDLLLAAAGRRLVERVTQSRRRDLERTVARMDLTDADALVRALLAFADASDAATVDDPFGWDLPT